MNSAGGTANMNLNIDELYTYSTYIYINIYPIHPYNLFILYTYKCVHLLLIGCGCQRCELCSGSCKYTYILHLCIYTNTVYIHYMYIYEYRYLQ